MSAIQRVFVATDLSEASDDAVRQAHAWATLFGAELVACHVVPDLLPSRMLMPHLHQADVEALANLEEKAALTVAARVAELTDRDASSFAVRVVRDEPYAGIVRAAEEVRADLVVVGSSGMTGLRRALLGSVADKVMRLAHCPVLIARPHAQSGKVLVATDFSDFALPAVQAGVEVAQRRGAKLTLMHCLELDRSDRSLRGLLGDDSPIHADAREQTARASAMEVLRGSLERFHGEGEVRVERGDARRQIPAVAELLGADLVVVGTLGRTGVERLRMGSTAEAVVRHTEGPVLVVRQNRPVV